MSSRRQALEACSLSTASRQRRLVREWMRSTYDSSDIEQCGAPDPNLGGNSATLGKRQGEAGAIVENSRIRGPTIVGKNTRVVNSYIGPYTSIYHSCLIEDSEIEHSIVLAGSSILNLHARMEASLLGKNVSLTRSDGMPKTLQFLVGDNAEIAIP